MQDHADENASPEWRERLERERARVGELIAELRSEASEMFEREKDLAILEGLEADLAEIEAALQRLDDGTFGVDEVTGDPIDPERLEALPTARTNVPTARTDVPPARS